MHINIVVEAECEMIVNRGDTAMEFLPQEEFGIGIISWYSPPKNMAYDKIYGPCYFGPWLGLKIFKVVLDAQYAALSFQTVWAKW